MVTNPNKACEPALPTARARVREAVRAVEHAIALSMGGKPPGSVVRVGAAVPVQAVSSKARQEVLAAFGKAFCGYAKALNRLGSRDRTQNNDGRRAKLRAVSGENSVRVKRP